MICIFHSQMCIRDSSGSRRFICIEVTGVIDTNRPIDYEQLYAQAMYELEHGERYWFDQEEEKDVYKRQAQVTSYEMYRDIIFGNNRKHEMIPYRKSVSYTHLFHSFPNKRLLYT